MPVLLVGGLGGSLATGRVLNYLDKPDEDRRLCGLYVGLMNRMGVPGLKFGDATASLAGL